MFSWMDFRGYGKKWREKWMKNDSFVCLVRRERGRENWWGPCVFSPTPPKHQKVISPKWREKRVEDQKTILPL